MRHFATTYRCPECGFEADSMFATTYLCRPCYNALKREFFQLVQVRETFCSHAAIPWRGHHEESCYTRPPAGP